MNAYRIKDSTQLKTGDAISIRFNGKWLRAFYSHVMPSGHVAVTLEGKTGVCCLPPSETYGIMVRN